MRRALLVVAAINNCDNLIFTLCLSTTKSLIPFAVIKLNIWSKCYGALETIDMAITMSNLIILSAPDKCLGKQSKIGNIVYVMKNIFAIAKIAADMRRNAPVEVDIQCY